MKAVDSSVAIRALLEQAEGHFPARTIVAESPSIPAHAVFETYSSLTRMPEPHRTAPEVALELLDANFGDRVLAAPSARSVLPWLRRVAARGVRGGALYDALIAESARIAGATLVTADLRAAATYRAVGVEVELLAE